MDWPDTVLEYGLHHTGTAAVTGIPRTRPTGTMVTHTMDMVEATQVIGGNCGTSKTDYFDRDDL